MNEWPVHGGVAWDQVRGPSQGCLREEHIRTLLVVLSIHSLIFRSFTRAHGRSGLCWCGNTGKRPIFMRLEAQPGTQVSNHGVIIQHAKWCGQLSLEKWGVREGASRPHLGPAAILQLCLWPSGRCIELSEEAGTSPGLSSKRTAFVASSPSQGPDLLPYQVVGPTLLNPYN